MAKTAVILMNLGAPDHLDAVQPFLTNLFSDPAILNFRVPSFVRKTLARIIARRRTPFAKEIYEQLGGQSPLYKNTILQSDALQKLLGDDFDLHIAMRYWHPRAEDIIEKLKKNPPDQIVLLPLYPQFSTTTTGSSVNEWMDLQRKADLDIPVHYICCYPEDKGFVSAQAALLEDTLRANQGSIPYRVLFSAHGLPKRIVDGGDPYPKHVELTARAIVDLLDQPSLDWRVCYQSRVGPVEWIKPYADDEIRLAGREGVSVVLVPLSFVSEHSETLIELDVEFKKIADASGVPLYLRVPTVGVAPSYIENLKDLVFQALVESPLSISPKSTLCKKCISPCKGAYCA